MQLGPDRRGASWGEGWRAPPPRAEHGLFVSPSPARGLVCDDPSPFTSSCSLREALTGVWGRGCDGPGQLAPPVLLLGWMRGPWNQGGTSAGSTGPGCLAPGVPGGRQETSPPSGTLPWHGPACFLPWSSCCCLLGRGLAGPAVAREPPCFCQLSGPLSLRKRRSRSWR